MALTPLDGRLPGQRRTDFGRRGPWGALFARSGNINKTTQGSTGGLTRRWAHGPANLRVAKLPALPYPPTSLLLDLTRPDYFATRN